MNLLKISKIEGQFGLGKFQEEMLEKETGILILKIKLQKK